MLHLLESEHIAIVNVVDKLFVFVGLLVSGSFGEMEPHKGDKGVNVCQSFRVIQKLGAGRRSRMVSTARTRGVFFRDVVDIVAPRYGVCAGDGSHERSGETG